MPVNANLAQRNGGLCELCNNEPVFMAFTVSPKNEDSIENQVALCNTCSKNMENKDMRFHWRCLEGSIWNPEPSVQALSYRILNYFKDEEWAADLMSSADVDEQVVQWALSAFEVADIHKDAFGNTLENGDNVVLIQSLDVKGTNFTASKGTVVKKIRLVHDHADQIEGKINDQTIVILCKFVKKN